MSEEPEKPVVEPTPIHLTVEDEANTFSQSGEDGIILRILELYDMNSTRGRAVDVGSWDGVYLSNTAFLRERGWDTCLIEADYDKHLLAMYAAGPKAVCVNAKVTPYNLDDLVERHFSGGVDVLSLDIDGDDIWVFDRMRMRPRIVVCEYNPTYPPFLVRINPLGTSKGSSLAAIEAVGKLQGYSLVYATISNAILVDTLRNEGIIAAKDSFGAFRWDLARFVVSDFDGANGLASINTVLNEVVNPWDGLPAVELYGYPVEMLGFGSDLHKELRQKWHDARCQSAGGSPQYHLEHLAD